LAAVVLAGLTFAVFSPALTCEFVNLDDSIYVVQNYRVKEGLTADGVRWAFTTFYAANWHPLTWLSLQLDATLSKKPDGGLDPYGFHLTNVLLHASNAALLFLALRSLTGAYWPAVATALLFAVHPLRVESVAWVTERKDVLSACFGLMALWAYAAYVRRSTVACYLMVCLFFTLSLLAKPMLVTLPCLLLVLDWWPLDRVHKTADWRHLLVEKLPLFGLAAASSVITYLAQNEGGALKKLAGFSLDIRVENAVISYAIYLVKTLLPTNLAVFYPHPAYGYNGSDGVAAPIVAGSAALVLAVTVTAVALRRRAPFLLTGWLWYVGTLVPVIGLVQVGEQGHADRYTYFPQVGLLLAICWGASDLARIWSRPAPTTRRVSSEQSRIRPTTDSSLADYPAVDGVFAGAVAIVFAIMSIQQLSVWKNSLDLWQNAYAVSGNCPTVLVNLGEMLEQRGDSKKAFELYNRAVKLDPNAAQIHLDLGNTLQSQGRLDDAAKEFQKACELEPEHASGYTNLGMIYFRQGGLKEAKQLFEKACKLSPDLGELYLNLGLVQDELKEYADATKSYEKALELRKNNYPRARAALGDLLVRTGQTDRGLALLKETVQSEPRSVEAHYRLARALESLGQLEDAAGHFHEATNLDPKLAAAWSDLGMIRVRQGRDDEAIEFLARSVRCKPSLLPALQKRLSEGNRPDLAGRLEERVRSAAPGLTP
jgi:tetratricopeptide (TPR) repeat protein